MGLKLKGLEGLLPQQSPDDDYPGRGWCGYLAYDQIRRKALRPADLSTLVGIKDLISTLDHMVRHGQGDYRGGD